jgi:integrase/recombinase XerD
MRFISRRLRRKSIKTVAEHIKEFLTWSAASGFDIENVTDDLYDGYVDALCACRKKTGVSLSWNAVNSRAAGAYRYLIWCFKQGYCSELAPAEISNSYRTTRNKYKVKGHPSKPPRGYTKFLILEDAIRFIDALAEISGGIDCDLKKRNKLVGSLLLQTGIRISEISDFPLRDLPEINSRGHSTPARVVVKGGKARLILIPNQLLLKLWEYVDLDKERICDRIEIKAGTRIVPDELFLSGNGNRLTSNWLEKLFSKTSAKIGIKTVPHSLRHTFGTYHLGVSVYSLYAWIKRYTKPQGQRVQEDDQSAELRRLPAQLKRVTEERDS